MDNQQGPNATKLTNVGNHLPEEAPTFPRYANCSNNIKETKVVQNTLKESDSLFAMLRTIWQTSSVKFNIHLSIF
jgi:hypothetical protein